MSSRPSPVSKKAPARVWQRMLSGRRLDLLDPSPVDIEVDDIAHGLARVARWNGQTLGNHAFSVAQHSVVVESVCAVLEPGLKPSERLMALHHDAAEYVIGDMISPFKAVLGDSYKDIENRLTESIHIRFGLPARMPASLKRLIKRADHVCAWYEATQLAGFSETEADRFFGSPPRTIELKLSPEAPITAQKSFMTRHETLLAEMEGRR
ncbi:HD family hydrolase [Henriciella sp.]|uniref:HD domain-containing protein n=1 Tax=Henriciella sp. TaxID=1968823 RepID=UPI00261C1D8F|nr:HD family hydrolase [Henriciella sp.]